MVCGEGRFSPKIVCLSVFPATELSEGRGEGKKKKKRVLKLAGRAGWCPEALLDCPVHVFPNFHHKMLEPSTNLVTCLQLHLSYHLTWIV